MNVIVIHQEISPCLCFSRVVGGEFLLAKFVNLHTESFHKMVDLDTGANRGNVTTLMSMAYACFSYIIYQ